jgi:hypothetical protein
MLSLSTPLIYEGEAFIDPEASPSKKNFYGVRLLKELKKEEPIETDGAHCEVMKGRY